MSSHQDRPLLVHHAARALGVSTRTVRWMAENKILEGFKDPRTPKLWRFRREDVEAFRARRIIAGRSSRRSATGNKTNYSKPESSLGQGEQHA
jgi:excisionase family DNA binding protein